MKVRTGIIAGMALGDSVAELTQLTGINNLAKTYEQFTGRSCGCSERREFLNQLLPSLDLQLR